MKVVLLGIYDRGKMESERLHFRANTDIDLRYYCILDSTHILPAANNLLAPNPFVPPNPYLFPVTAPATGSIYAGQKTCFWFTSRTIRAYQNIVLYTRAGVPNEESRPDGMYFHFLFRGLKSPIYTDPKASATIFELNDWITTPAQ